MKHRLLGPLVLSLLAACHVTLLGDLEVAWEIDGSDSTDLCATYNIGSWHVLASGPERYSVDVQCQDYWDTGVSLHGIEEGVYDVTVEAIEVGTGDVIAAVKQNNVDVLSGASPASPLISFTASDFGGGDTLNVYWNINGTQDGTPKGLSWDTCSEVGASYAEIEVNGSSTIEDCHAGGNMAAAVTGISGQPTVRVRLLDDQQTEITTWTASATADAGTDSNTWEYVAEFYWDSFLDIKNTMTGDYLFQVSYEGQSCTQTSPNVAHQVSLLKLDGTAVNPVPDVCGPDSYCVPADGASFASCYGPDQTQDISNILWREYTLTVSGALPASSSYEVCWESTFDIVVGAGTDNPVDQLDVDRYSTSGACQ